MAKFIAEAHGGHVWIQSEGPDKGASFVLELPLHMVIGAAQNVSNISNIQDSSRSTVSPPSVVPFGNMGPPSGSLVHDREVIHEMNQDKDSAIVGEGSVGLAEEVVGHVGLVGNVQSDVVTDMEVREMVVEMEKEKKEGEERLIDSLNVVQDSVKNKDKDEDKEPSNILSRAQKYENVVGFAGFHVLVVEDSPSARKVHRQ